MKLITHFLKAVSKLDLRLSESNLFARVTVE